MKILESENVVCYDVDDTLVLWDRQTNDGFAGLLTYVTDPFDGKDVCLQVHVPHVKLLKNHKARGKTVVVWSQGGYKWARAVVTALGLEDHVDLIMSKPRSYIDDLPADAWLKDRIYISPDSNWGEGIKE